MKCPFCGHFTRRVSPCARSDYIDAGRQRRAGTDLRRKFAGRRGKWVDDTDDASERAADGASRRPSWSAGDASCRFVRASRLKLPAHASVRAALGADDPAGAAAVPETSPELRATWVALRTTWLELRSTAFKLRATPLAPQSIWIDPNCGRHGRGCERHGSSCRKPRSFVHRTHSSVRRGVPVCRSTSSIRQQPRPARRYSARPCDETRPSRERTCSSRRRI